MENVEKWLKQKYVVIVVLIVVCLGIKLYLDTPVALDRGGVPSNSQHSSEESSRLITVYVSGAVASPGMYEIQMGSRAQDAVLRAGGMLAEADSTRVNLAKKLKDGMQVNVPYQKVVKTKTTANRSVTQKVRTTIEKSGNATKQTSTVQKKAKKLEAGEKINLNTASLEELCRLPGVGEATALKIIDYRERQHFHSVEDLKKIKGISKSKFERLEPYLEV